MPGKQDDMEISLNPRKDRALEVYNAPEDAVEVGNPGEARVKVYIRDEAFSFAEEFAKEDLSRELGAILVGRYFEGSGEDIVVIEDMIEARHTDADQASITFTHETWEEVFREMDENYPESRIVGWFHTHPGFGIFLSNMDLFIHENFFNLPWQIAYVVDPRNRTRGFFNWYDEGVLSTPGYYIYGGAAGEIVNRLNEEEVAIPEEAQEIDIKKGKKLFGKFKIF